MSEAEELPVDEKGRISIPKHAREQLGLAPGERLRFSIRGNEIRLTPVAPKVVKLRARRKWGPEAFLCAGEALFAGEE